MTQAWEGSKGDEERKKGVNSIFLLRKASAMRSVPQAIGDHVEMDGLAPVHVDFPVVLR